MDRRQIIMNFSVPPSAEDLALLSSDVFETLPEELLEFCDDVEIEIEEFPDTATETELELDDPYELTALYRNGKEISPGIEKISEKSDDKLILYRRAILDMWCETEDELSSIIRQVMIEEIGRTFEFSESEIEEMINRHYQGML